jgi:hypothetical protein
MQSKGLRDAPKTTRTAMQFIPLKTVDEAIQAALRQTNTSLPPPTFKLV